MLEKQIEKAVCDYAKSVGILSYKFSSPGHAAVPDRLFVINSGRVFFIEFKRGGCKPTSAQKREHMRLEGHNLSVYVVDSVLGGEAIIDAELITDGLRHVNP